MGMTAPGGQAPDAFRGKEGIGLPWYGWLMLAALIIGPFDALYLYIKAGKRRKRQREADASEKPDNGGNA